jgi:tRNA(Ile)-lysidine synthase
VRDGRIIRPLLRVRRNEILEFLDREGLTYMLDSSNFSPIFLRNRIRNHLIPELKAHYNPRIVSGLCNLSEIMRREDDYWQITVQQIFQQWRILPGAVENLLPVNAFLDLHEALQGRIIKFLLEASAPLGRGIGYRHIESVLALFRAPHNRRRISIDLPWQISVEREEKILRIRKVICPRRTRGGEKGKKLPQGFSRLVEIPGIVYLPEIQKSIRFEFVEKPGIHEMKSQSRVAFLDYERLSPPLILRSMKPGDRIAPLGMAGIKKLKSYFIDRKIPSSSRRMIPLLVDNRAIICWIAEERINDQLKVTEHTKKVLKAEMV